MSAQPLVIVTGSAGFLGQALIARLVDRFTVVGLEAMLPEAASSAFETIRTDLTSDASVRAPRPVQLSTTGARSSASSSANSRRSITCPPAAAMPANMASTLPA